MPIQLIGRNHDAGASFLDFLSLNGIEPNPIDLETGNYHSHSVASHSVAGRAPHRQGVILVFAHLAKGDIPTATGFCGWADDQVTVAYFQFDLVVEMALFQKRFGDVYAARITDLNDRGFHSIVAAFSRTYDVTI